MITKEVNLLDKRIWIEDAPIRPVLKTLLLDKTTGGNIIFATGDYQEYGDEYTAQSHMTEDLLLRICGDIQPRAFKSIKSQKNRTHDKAEVMTPPWIVCMMNGHCDEDWFGRPSVFEKLEGQIWKPRLEPILFPNGEKKTWMDYVDCRRLEITCGEAPYIVTRYDATTGDYLPINRRVGFLDHKLRVVNENAETEEVWFKWVVRAFQSSYGYEFQGDNLLIARINLLLTFCEYLEARWEREPKQNELQRIATIISWNLWQMDAFTETIPFGIVESPDDPWEQLTFDIFEEKAPILEKSTPPCLIRNWRLTGEGGRALKYSSLGR